MGHQVTQEEGVVDLIDEDDFVECEGMGRWEKRKIRSLLRLLGRDILMWGEGGGEYINTDRLVNMANSVAVSFPITYLGLPICISPHSNVFGPW